jgi:hypothetical protein
MTLAVAFTIGASGCADDDTLTVVVGMDGGTDSDVESVDPADTGVELLNKNDGGPGAKFAKSAIAFQSVACGSAQSQTLSVTNSGGSPLALSVTATGGAFSVSPTALTVESGKTGAFSVTATVPASSTAGVPLSGSLNFFTNDPGMTHLVVPLTATPSGATLAFQPGGQTSFAFPATGVGSPESLTLTVVNVGNLPASFSLGAPTDPEFSFSGSGSGGLSFTLAQNATFSATASFTPTDLSPMMATSTVGATGATCGASLQSIALTGQGGTGTVTGWPTTLDFGPVECGGAAPNAQLFSLSNPSTIDAHIVEVSLTGSGFSTTAAVGDTIPAGGQLSISIAAPAVPLNSPLTPIAGTVAILTDADPAGASPHLITVSEEPTGAILAFDTSATPNFGSYGSVQLLASASQNFSVTNTGTSAATVTLTANVDSASDAGTATPFSVATPSFSLGSNGAESEYATFTPLVANGVTGSVAISANGPICGPLPAPLPLSGSGLGGGPAITPTSLVFAANCGGAAPTPQSFIVRNDGTADMRWAVSGPLGPGASQYTLAAGSPLGGLLVPGAFATLTVNAAAIPSPVPNPSPSAFVATLTVTTDVPLDPPHVVSLGEPPLGDQLSFAIQATTSPLRFGQVPIDTSLRQLFTVTNSANPGSAVANLSFALVSSGTSGYSTPGPMVVAPGASGSGTISFSPKVEGPYPAGLAIATTDGLCAPLPAPLPLSGTGTQGVVSLSANELAFGTDPSDPNGFVNCGSMGLAKILSVSNVGNQAFDITGLTLAQGASSPFSWSGVTLPVNVPIGAGTTGNNPAVSISLTPTPIPATVANPSTTAFSDTLTVTTDAALDTPHTVQLIMQPRGAVIASTPLTTMWPFGSVLVGSIGTFANQITNTGNASVSIALQGFAQPDIFGLQMNPTIAPGGNVVTPLVGQFTPPSAFGSWVDTGTLVVTPVQALCEPLPPQWATPTIQVSGNSNLQPALTVTGNLIFPSTDCGSPAPDGQAVTINNLTKDAYSFSAAFASGKYYTILPPGGSGSVPANGTATVIVSPNTITPGPGVAPGSAPYADNLLITVDTVPPAQFSIPIWWALNGAVLSLPEGEGTQTDEFGTPFYPADSFSGFALPMANTGTATATVGFAISPADVWTFSPADASFQVIPGIGATPGLVSTSSDPACPTKTTATATFQYSGPVCQPFSVSSVTIEACTGTF